MSTHYLPEALPSFLRSWRTVCREAAGLADVHERLFVAPLTAEMVASWSTQAEWSDRLEAFAARYARLQDQLGEKTLPRLLALFGQQSKTLLDTLHAAERLGIVESAESWLILRALRNRLVHEYIESNDDLLAALQAAQPSATTLLATVQRIRDLLQLRQIPEQENH